MVLARGATVAIVWLTAQTNVGQRLRSGQQTRLLVPVKVQGLLQMEEGSAGQGCWFESLLQGPMMTYGDGGGLKS